MSLKEKINSDLKNALKQKEELRLSVLRLLNSAIHNKEIEKKKKDIGLSDEEILEVINSEVKKRKDAADLYNKGGRGDSARKEEAELKILMEYLPKQLSEDELKGIIEETIIKVGAKSEKDFGRLMKEITPKTKGRADGALAVKLTKELLASKYL